MMANNQNMDYEKEFAKYLEREKTLGHMITQRVEKFGDSRVAVRHKVYDHWEAFTWKQLGEMIDSTAQAMLEHGVQVEEKVGIFSANRVEWAVADFACFNLRAVSVPVYATNSASELEYIVNHADIRLLFVGDQEQYEKALQVKEKSPSLEKIIVFDRRVDLQGRSEAVHLDDFMEQGRKSGKEEEYRERYAGAHHDDLATIIYTSGTTGKPKGVMLTHKNFMAAGFGAGYHLPIEETDVNLAFLPLSHIFERSWSYHILQGNGQVDYCHDTGALETFLQESRPHYMCSVPRIWEKIHAKVNEGIKNSPPKKQKLFQWALDVGWEVECLKRDQKRIPAGFKIKHRLADKLVLNKIKTIFGGRTKVYNVGGAPFSGEIAKFFFKAGVLLLQGYGLTECFVISVANPTHNKFGTCGPVVPLVDVRIADDGELEARGPNMMQGYYKEPELTKEMFTEDGWIKTGDLGYIDEDGYVVITDRKKDLMKTAGGKYIAPQQIETMLIEDYYIEQAVAVAEGRKFVSALIVPTFEALEEYARSQGLENYTREDLVQHPTVINFYREIIDRRTVDLGQVEKIKKFVLVPYEFTQETGDLTPTQKLKRKVVFDKYQDYIEDMYQE